MSTEHHPADRLLAAIERVGAPVCVGLDPVLERLPDAIRPAAPDAEAAARACRDFGIGVVDAVAEHVPCVKVQSACYERYGAAGVAARDETLAHAERCGLEIILDAKRGDIGVSAQHYAAMQRATGATWMTVSPYLGAETIEPYVGAGFGAFALVRTSNRGGEDLQGQTLADGGRLDERVADLVATLGRDSVGAGGFSAVGAVVGATRPADALRLRERMPEQIFLVPGFGAQGGGVEDILPCFREDGRGAIVTASRSVIYAFEAGDPDWARGVAGAARELAETVGDAVRARV